MSSLPENPASARPPAEHAPRTLLIALTGLLCAVAAGVFVFAPVQQDVATYHWAGPDSPALPLFPYQPDRLDASFACGAAASLTGGTVLATAPPAGKTGAQFAGNPLIVRVDGGMLTAKVGERTIATQPVGGPCAWRIVADAGGTSVTADGREIGRGPQRPDVNGLFTDLTGTGNAPKATVIADTRFQSDPGVVKIAAGVVAAGALIALFVLLRRRDRRFARLPRVLPRRFWRPRATDLSVTAVLACWAVIGPLTVDDGYIITMLRSAGDTGFMGNFFRWFNAPEAPFGWFYELYRPLAEVSANPVWMRLPSVLLGLASWALIDRVLLPRLTSAPRLATRWVCAALFLLWYLPFNVGVRPEPWVVLGSLVVFALVERAIVTSALTPLAAAVVVAGATVAITPTGTVAFVPFVAALPALARLLRRSRLGWPALVPVLFGAAASVLLFMFYDQTIGTVIEATRVRTEVGPAQPWYTELGRYRTLLDPSVVEGSLSRRMPVLLTLFAMLAIGALLLLRRHPGLARAAGGRLVVASVLYLVALSFTPTKWTHHFGALAGFGALLLALLVHTVARGALRPALARAVVVAALTVPIALALAGPNGWWYVSAYNVKWGEGIPTLAGFPVWQLVLAAGAVLAVATLLLGDRKPARWISPATVVAVVAAGTLVIELGSLGYAVKVRKDTYSVGMANLTAAGAGRCGIEHWLTVEPDASAGLLRPATATTPSTAGFATNKDFPETRALLAPYGTDAAPVWSNQKSSAAGDTLTTGWYQLPAGPSVSDDAPLVFPFAGKGSVFIDVEFAGKDGQVTTIRMDRGAGVYTDQAWHELRIDRSRAAGADRVRIVVPALAGGSWAAVGAPRVPKTVPLDRIVPQGEPVMVDWVNAFVLPCRQPPNLTDGMIRPVRYRFAPGPADRELAAVSYADSAGGPYPPLLQLAADVPVPTYLRGDPGREPISVYRLDYPTPLAGVRTEHGTRERGALTVGPPLLR